LALKELMTVLAFECGLVGTRSRPDGTQPEQGESAGEGANVETDRETGIAERTGEGQGGFGKAEVRSERPGHPVLLGNR
jgi:hypothetical protein